MANIKDISGQRFGKLIAVRPTDERRKRNAVWECKCDCGKTTLVSGANLQRGYTISCGCTKRGKRAKDLTGQRFGQLTAVRPTGERKYQSTVWECKCDCGKTTFVTVANLRIGGTESCGCTRKGKKAVDLTGQRFGKLVAIRKTDERINGSIVWECKCDCGNTHLASVNQLRTGHVKSCGCARWKKVQGAGEEVGSDTRENKKRPSV
jgi:hypothetical protein